MFKLTQIRRAFMISSSVLGYSSNSTLPSGIYGGPYILSENSVENTVIGNILGKTTGSTLTLVNNLSNRVKLVGTQLLTGPSAFDFETTSPNPIIIQVQEDLGNYSEVTDFVLNITDVYEATVTAFPSAATTGTDLSRAAAFQTWWLANVPDGANFWTKKALLRSAMGAGVTNTARTDGTLDPRWSSGTGLFNLTAVGANAATNLVIPGGIYADNGNPTSITVSNILLTATGEFYGIQRDANAISGKTSTITNIEAIGGDAAFNDGSYDNTALQTYTGVYTRQNKGDAFKGGSQQRFERCWGEAMGYGEVTAHGDGFQQSAGVDCTIINTVFLAVADPTDTYGPANAQYTTNSFGLTSALRIDADVAPKIVQRQRFYGVVMGHGGFYQITIGGDSGETIRNLIFAYGVGCPDAFRLASDSAKKNIFPGWKDAPAGIRENICFYGMKNADGSEMLEDGLSLTGIWHYNPTTLDATTIAELKVLGLLDSAGNPTTGAVRSVAASYMPVLPYTLLYDFETTGTYNPYNSNKSLHTGSRKALGTAGMLIQGTGTNTNTSGDSLVTGSTVNFNSHERVMVCVDLGDNKFNMLSQLRPAFNSAGTDYLFAPPAGVSNFIDIQNFVRGKVWVSRALASFKVNAVPTNASIQSVGTAAKRIDISMNAGGAGAVDLVMDAMVLQSTHKPSIIIAGDDMHASHETVLRPELDSRGLKGNVYLCRSLVDQSLRMTNAQVLAFRAAGHGIGLDAERNSLPITSFATRAAWLSALQTDIAAAITSYGDTEGAKHLCYSFGRTGYPDLEEVQSIYSIPNGTTEVTVGGTNAFAKVTVGARVFDGGTYRGVVTAIAADGSSYTCSGVVPTGSPRNIDVVAIKLAASVTCNGTTTVTMASTTNLFAGMHFNGRTDLTPAGVKIASVDSGTQLTMTAAIPAGVTRGDFSFQDGEWWPTKVVDDLASIGIKTARTTNGGGLCTGFGANPQRDLLFPGISIDFGVNVANTIALIQQQVIAGNDIILYMHALTSGQVSGHLAPILDAINTLVDGGSALNPTLGEYGTLVAARGAIA